jgi:hypothetical protein
MDWTQAIERNRAALLAVVAAIAGLLGGGDGGPVARSLRNAALALLRPAEAAARRLIVVAARGLSAAPPLRRATLFITNASAGRRAGLPPAFPLFDRWKRFGRMLRRASLRGIPRIRGFWGDPQPSAVVQRLSKTARADPDAPVDVGRLRLRLRSLELALADIPRQARRLARARARLEAAARPRSPLRPGRPPGWRLRPARTIDEVLRDCHLAACGALQPDTS